MRPAQGVQYKSLKNDSSIFASEAQITSNLDVQNSTVECKGTTFVDFSLDTLSVDTINERTVDHGVEVDGVLLKDGTVTTTSAVIPRISNLTSNGFLKSSGGDGTLVIDTSTYENPLTFTAPLLRSVNTISLDTVLAITQISNLTSAGFVKTDSKGNTSVDTTSYITPTDIAGKLNRTGDYMQGPLDFKGYSATDVKLGSLTSNGFVRTSAGDGTLTIDTSTYLTGNQTITLSGDISGSGTTAITTTIGALKVTNAMLAGSIAASKLIGTDITTVGTIGTGTWQGSTISTLYGGTGQTSYTNGQLLIGNASNTLTKATLTAVTDQTVISNGNGSITIGTVQNINTTSSPQFLRTTLSTSSDSLALLVTANLASQTGLQVLPHSSTGDGCRMYFNDELGNYGFSMGSVANNGTILNWNNGFNISRHQNSATGSVVMSIDRKVGGITFLEDTLFDNKSNTFYGATTFTSTLKMNALTATSLLALDASKNLTNTTSGISPTFTGLNLSGLTASSLVATDASKNLTSTVSGLTPTLTGMVLNGGNIEIQRLGVPKGAMYIAGNEFVISGNSLGSLRLYSQSGSIIYSPDNAATYIGHNATNFFPGTTNTMNLGTTGNRWASVNGVLGNYSGVLSCADGTVSVPGINFGLDPNTGIYRIGTDNLGITCNGIELIDVLTAGVTMARQPSFNGYPSVDLTNQTGDGTGYTVILNTEIMDAGSNFNTTTGVFTAPIAGRYLLTAQVTLIGLTSSHTACNLQINNGAAAIARSYINPWAIRNSSSLTTTISVNTIVQLAAAENISIILNVSGGTKVVGVQSGRSNSYFSGQLLS
jgi:hypothetical protein